MSGSSLTPVCPRPTGKGARLAGARGAPVEGSGVELGHGDGDLFGPGAGDEHHVAVREVGPAPEAHVLLAMDVADVAQLHQLRPEHRDDARLAADAVTRAHEVAGEGVDGGDPGEVDRLALRPEHGD